MTDPKEKDLREEQENTTPTQNQSTDQENTNWDAHQQIDEEGNEIGPDDIK